MEGREAMALSGGLAQYYIHRGGDGGSGSATQTGVIQTPPCFRHVPSPTLPSHSSIRPNSAGSAFSAEPSPVNFHHGITVAVSPGTPSTETVKKKRGRPRKYAPDGAVSLGLSPMSAPPKPSSSLSSPSQKRGRGRPPGSGRKQILASIGGWMNSSAGLAFAPHIICIAAGEDIAAKIFSFSLQRPRAVCILSGTGTVSSVTLRQPASSAGSGTITYEGRFEILCLSGSYLVAEDGGPRNRTGGISVSLSSPDGHVIGGAVAMLLAASPVQVVVCSFVYGGNKSKIKQLPAPKVTEDSEKPAEKSATPATPASTPQNYTPAMGVWPGGRPLDQRNPHTDIDLTRG